MSNHYFELALIPPHGVSFVQWADGTLRFRYAAKDAMLLREAFTDMAKRLTEEAVKQLEAEKTAEIERQRMPMSTLEKLNQQIQTLKDQPSAALPPMPDLGKLVFPAPDDEPIVVVSKVTADPLGV